MSNNDVYLGNPLLKKANTTHEFTEEQVFEIVNCMKDPVYFANNYVKIVTLDHGLQSFKPYHFQENTDLISVRCLVRLEKCYPLIHPSQHQLDGLLWEI
jgi:hypothetical protein